MYHMIKEKISYRNRDTHVNYKGKVKFYDLQDLFCSLLIEYLMIERQYHSPLLFGHTSDVKGV